MMQCEFLPLLSQSLVVHHIVKLENSKSSVVILFIRAFYLADIKNDIRQNMVNQIHKPYTVINNNHLNTHTISPVIP